MVPALLHSLPAAAAGLVIARARPELGGGQAILLLLVCSHPVFGPGALPEPWQPVPHTRSLHT